MKADEVDGLVGIYEQDGSVRCRECMEDEDWNHLSQETAITLDDVENGERLFYCDYCEQELG
jgi:hypothetical protein